MNKLKSKYISFCTMSILCRFKGQNQSRCVYMIIQNAESIILSHILHHLTPLKKKKKKLVDSRIIMTLYEYDPLFLNPSDNFHLFPATIISGKFLCCLNRTMCAVWNNFQIGPVVRADFTSKHSSRPT